MSSVNGSPSPVKFTSAEKRAVHNALERKRRDHIKDMFSQLKDSVPNLSGEKVSVKASRAQILKKACDYIQLMRRKNQLSAKELDVLNQQVSRTKKQIAKLESVRNTNRYVATLPQQNVIPPQLSSPLSSSIPLADITTHPSFSSTYTHSSSSIDNNTATTPTIQMLPHHSLPAISILPPRMGISGPPPIGGPYRMALASMTLENYNLMTQRLPSMSNLQRFYVPSEVTMQTSVPDNRAATPTGTP